MDEALKILLIDDDEDEYVLCRDLLEDAEGGRFSLAWESGFEKGFESVVAGAYDAYLVDFRLGASTGIDLLEAVREAGVRRAVILLTGQGDTEIDRLAMELGASDYLVKGEVSAANLERAIRYAVERERNEARLRFQAEILRNVHDAIFYVDREGTILDWNEGAKRIFGLEAAEAVGKSIREICNADAANPFDDSIVPAIRSRGKAEKVVRCHHRDGSDIYVRAKVTPMPLGAKEGYVFCASDITNEKRLEAEIVRISELEQQRIGQDIHDDLCSQLSGIGCLAKLLARQLAEHHREEAEMMSKITEMVADAGERAREIAKGLVPAALETRGLAGALRDLAERNGKTFGVGIDLAVDDEALLQQLDPAVSVQLYRIVQEALANALKHSDAERIAVRVGGRDGRLDLSVKDDGRGMCPDSFTAGLGLLTMRRRSEIVGADFDVRAFPGEGTEIRFSLPGAFSGPALAPVPEPVILELVSEIED